MPETMPESSRIRIPVLLWQSRTPPSIRGLLGKGVILMINLRKGYTSAFESLDSENQVSSVGVSIYTNARVLGLRSSGSVTLQFRIVERLKSLDNGSACRFGCCGSKEG